MYRVTSRFVTLSWIMITVVVFCNNTLAQLHLNNSVVKHFSRFEITRNWNNSEMELSYRKSSINPQGAYLISGLMNGGR